jgi:AraC-like DNA-binding protein
MKTKVLIIVKNLSFGERIRNLFSTTSANYDLIGVEYNGALGLEQFRKFKPQIIIIDASITIIGVEKYLKLMEGYTRDFIVILLSEIKDESLENNHRIFTTLTKTGFNDEIFLDSLNAAYSVICKQLQPAENQQSQEYFEKNTKLVGNGDFSLKKLFILRDNFSWKMTSSLNILLPRPSKRITAISVEVLNQIRSILYDYQGGEVVVMQDGVICILVNELQNTSEHTSEERYEEMFNRIKLELTKETQTHFTFFFSNEIALNELKKKYADFLKFYKLGYFVRDISILKPGSLPRKTNVHQTEKTERILLSLITDLFKDTYDLFDVRLRSLYLSILKQSMNTDAVSHFREKLELLGISVINLIPEHVSTTFPNAFSAKYLTIEDEFEDINNFFYMIYGYLSRKRIQIDSMILQSIVLTIEYLSIDVSLNFLADKIHVSPSYLSHKFKKEMGVNLTHYQNEIRIYRAKQLLSDYSIKMYEVAHESGFSNHRYFSQVFKKKTAMTPSEFRNSISSKDINGFPLKITEFR